MFLNEYTEVTNTTKEIFQRNFKSLAGVDSEMGLDSIEIQTKNHATLWASSPRIYVSVRND